MDAEHAVQKSLKSGVFRSVQRNRREREKVLGSLVLACSGCRFLARREVSRWCTLLSLRWAG
jgi:hypothetical protein